MPTGSGADSRSSAERLAILLAALAACAGPLSGPPAERLYPTRNPARLEALRAGLAPAAVLARMGSDPVPHPLEPERPFANPHQQLVFEAPGARRVELWLYLTELRTRPECPFLEWRDQPVVFEEGRLVAWSWAGLRERLEDYGRSADWYRHLRYPRFGDCRAR